MGDGTGIALGAVLGGLVTAIGAVIVSVMKTRHDQQRETDGAAIAEYKGLVEMLRQQIDRLTRQLDEQQEGIAELHGEREDCQVELSDVYGHLQLNHTLLVRLADIVRRKGDDPGQMPELPQRRPRPERRTARADFVRRTTEQNTALAHAVNQAIVPPQAIPTSPSPPHQGGPAS